VLTSVTLHRCLATSRVALKETLFQLGGMQSNLERYAHRRITGNGWSRRCAAGLRTTASNNDTEVTDESSHIIADLNALVNPGNDLANLEPALVIACIESGEHLHIKQVESIAPELALVVWFWMRPQSLESGYMSHAATHMSDVGGRVHVATDELSRTAL
jgi:hypothetical protein